MEKKTARVSMKRILGILLIVFSVIIMTFPVVPDLDAAAKTKKKKTETVEGQDGDLKNLNITWDIKKGKTVKAKTNYNVVGERKFKIKMTKYKVKNLKKGKKRITFTMKYSNLAPNITVEQGEKVYFDYESNGIPAGGGFFLTVVDPKTGLSIEKGNSKVSVASDGFTCSDYKYTYLFGSSPDEEDQSWYVYYPNKATITVTVTCPKDTESIVILAGGIKHPEIDNTPFFNGEIKFSESALYVPEDKSYVHAMEIKLSEPTATATPVPTETPEPTATPIPTATPTPAQTGLSATLQANANDALARINEAAATYGWTITSYPIDSGLKNVYAIYVYAQTVEDEPEVLDGIIEAGYNSDWDVWRTVWKEHNLEGMSYSSFIMENSIDGIVIRMEKHSPYGDD